MPSVYAILIAVFCSFWAEIAMAEPGVISCEHVLAGSQKYALTALLSPHQISKIYYSYRIEDSLRDSGRILVKYHFPITVLKPKEGIGNLLSLVAIKDGGDSLWKAAREHLQFFARFDIFAKENLGLIMPDTKRLNSLMKNGVRFSDVPIYSQQLYNEDYFTESLEAGFIPLGMYGYYFAHDRLQEHLMGALIMPNWLYQQYLNYTRFEKALFESEAWKTALPDAKERKAYEKYYAEFRSAPSLNWDRITAGLGLEILLHTDNGKLTHWDIRSYQHEFLLQSHRLTPGHEDSHFRRYLGDENRDAFLPKFKHNAEFMAALKKMETQFAIVAIDEDFATQEAIRTLHEVTRTPVEELESMWLKGNKK